MLALLPSGLWVLDETHPVAAVLDPRTGAVRRVVSWPQVEPGPSHADVDLPLLHSDGTGLWVQPDPHGPLVRVDTDGPSAAVWTDGLSLAACGPGVAWCRAAPVGERPQRWNHPGFDVGQLLRVDRHGAATRVLIQGRVERVQAGPDALYVLLAVPPTEESETAVQTGWARLPWDAELPDELTIARYGADHGPDPVPGTVDRRFHSWHEVPPRPTAIATEHHRWCLGWVQEQPQLARDRRPLRATAHTPDGVEVRRWDLGRGEVLAVADLGDRLAVTVRRVGPVCEVLALDPSTSAATVLLAPDSVDITGRGWPPAPRPAETDSYLGQVRARSDTLAAYWRGPDGVRPLVVGLTDSQVAIIGDWPETVLEWTFRWTGRPGVLLRRRVRLFDELGRITNPANASVDLSVDLETGHVPRTDEAVDGVLDI